MSLEAVTCTVELSTGSLIEVSETPRAVLDRRLKNLNTGAFIRLHVLTGTGRSDADYRQEVFVDPLSIVAVYPLDERPIPPRRVYVDRVEVHSRT